MIRPADPSVPGLQTALDVDAVLELLRKALPEVGDGLGLEKNTIVDVRYRPGGPCWILYRLKVRDGKRSSRQLLSGRLLGESERPETLPRELLARYRDRGDTVFDTPVVYLPEVPMQLFAFPLDSSLPGLFDATDASALKRHLNRMWSRRGVRVRRVTPRPLGYTPHARAAFLYEILGECRDSGLPELRRLIGKMHAKKQTARLFADAWAVWRAAEGRIGLAPPVGYIPSAGLTLQEKVAGQRLGGLVDTPGFDKWVKQTARALATLHGLTMPLSSRRKPAEEARGVHRWAGVLMAIRPDMARRVERLRDKLASELEVRARLSGPIHADFHHTNVLVDGENVTIIDLDEVAFGDPMVDVGRFLASLRVPARRAFGDIAALNGAGATFLEAYLNAAGGDEKRAHLFEAASLLIAAGSSFRIQRPSWEEEVSLLVEESERVLHLAGNGTAPRPPAPVPQQSLPPEDQRRWTRDGVYMQAVLGPHIRTTYGAELHRCDVRGHHDAGNSDRLRFELRGWRGADKWSRSLRGIHWPERRGRARLERLERLSEALDASPDAPVLPRPVAYVKKLSLLVCEIPDGARLSSLAGSADGPAAAERLAGALLAVHGARVELGERLRLSRRLEGLSREIESLGVTRPKVARRSASLMDKLDGRFSPDAERTTPILRIVHPHHVLVTDDAVVLERVDQLGDGHPLLDLSDLLSRLRLLGLRNGEMDEVAESANCFRDAYGAQAPIALGELAAFETLALVRLAVKQVNRDSSEKTAMRLLDVAEEVLDS